MSTPLGPLEKRNGQLSSLAKGGRLISMADRRCGLAPALLPGRRVKLNVGGDKFETTLSTLTRHPDSTLAVMFSGRHEVPQDDGGYVFIDRDGTHFRTILNFLRTGVLDVPTSQKAASELTRELQYYQLDTCVEAGALSTTASTPGSFELVATCANNPADHHTIHVRAKLKANPSLKVVNSFVTHAQGYLFVYTETL